jgi:hypothetical protein
MPILSDRGTSSAKGRKHAAGVDRGRNLPPAASRKIPRAIMRDAKDPSVDPEMQQPL